jgi:uncharacterized protein (TIGR03083 family)
MSRADEIEEWTRAQERVVALVSGLSDDEVATRVPACPDWTVRDLLAHVVGLGADVVAGNEVDDHNADWTQAQVDARRDTPVADLLAEWRDLTGPLQEWMAEHGTRPLGDVIIHEQDLRGAVGVPGGRDSAGLRAIRDRFAPRLAAALAGAPPVALRGERWRWVSDGEGGAVAAEEADTVVEDAADAAPVVLAASDFDLARALVTRRSAAQLRSWTVRGDVTPHLEAFALLGPLPTVDLSE